MKKEEILEIATKYRKLATSMEPENDEKGYKFERFADYIEENDDIFEDDYYETEEELFEHFNEVVAEEDAQWDDMFPEGDEDDSITDFLTK
jgi:hypothetical protein